LFGIKRQQSKIKMGGLLALQEMISHSSVDTIDNITILVGAIKKEVGDFEKIPFSASANGANAIVLMIPCHRIIGSDGV
jgi:methylated-DNA-[protein]-cysteine S-methyltransferase